MAAAKVKKSGDQSEAKPAAALASLKYEYLCSACTDVAIKTSNIMLDVSIVCESCGKTIKLDDKKRYKKLKKEIKR